MASIMSYLKANFMLTKKPLFFGIESDNNTNKINDKLFNYSIKFNDTF